MKKKKKIKDKIIVTGSEGLIGKSLVKQLSKSFNLVKVDLKLGHDLTDEKKVIKIINSNKDSVGLVNLFSINPQPNDLKKDLFSISIESLNGDVGCNKIIFTIFLLSCLKKKFIACLIADSVLQ